MKNNKPKKPTNADFKNAITNLIQEHARLVQYVRSIDAAFTEYVKFNKNEETFTKYIEEKRKKNEQSRKEDTGKSPSGDRTAKIASIQSKAREKSKAKS